MVVRMQFLRFPPENNAEVKRLYRDELLPALQRVKGIRNARLLEPAQPSDAFVAITEWETEADAQDFEMGGLYDQQRKKIISFTVTEPVFKTYRFEPVHTDVWVGD